MFHMLKLNADFKKVSCILYLIYRYALSSTLVELKPEVKVTVTWKHLVTRQGPRCIYIADIECYLK